MGSCRIRIGRHDNGLCKEGSLWKRPSSRTAGAAMMGWWMLATTALCGSRRPARKRFPRMACIQRQRKFLEFHQKQAGEIQWRVEEFRPACEGMSVAMGQITRYDHRGTQNMAGLKPRETADGALMAVGTRCRFKGLSGAGLGLLEVQRGALP